MNLNLSSLFILFAFGVNLSYAGICNSLSGANDRDCMTRAQFAATFLGGSDADVARFYGTRTTFCGTETGTTQIGPLTTVTNFKLKNLEKRKQLNIL